jgi:DNA-binding transcriptional LysR family regulator
MPDADLRDLAAFTAVARLRSFRRAAIEQGMSVSSVSQRLRTLEERLGVRLLNRTTRSVAATEAGERLLERLVPALQGVGEALAEIRNAAETPKGRLRINAPAPAARLVLAPMIAAFLTRYPAITLELIVETSLVDIVAAGFDAGVRFEEHLAQDMIAVPLGPPQRDVVTAAPALVAKHGLPREPADLAGMPCLAVMFPSGKCPAWEFEKAGRVINLSPAAAFRSSDMEVLLRAAIDGAGFLATFEGYARPALDKGQLIAVLDDWCPSFPGPFLYYPSRRQVPAPLAAFVAFVSAWRRGD